MMPSKSFVFHFDDVEVREREFTLIKAGKVLTVEPKAFRTLLFLLHNPQRLISKEELLNTVWGDAAVTEGSLTRCVWLLRSLLGDDIRQPRYIATVARVGYRFVCKVEVSEEASGNFELHQPPVPAREVNPELPSGLEPIISKLHEMDRQLRYQHAVEVRDDLRSVGLKMPRQARGDHLRPASRNRWFVVGIGVAIFFIAVGAFFWWKGREPRLPPVLSQRQLTTNSSENPVSAGAISPDGRYLAYADLLGIHIKLIATGETHTVPQPESLKGIQVIWGILNEWMPDGTHLIVNAFLPGQEPSIWNVPVIGGAPHRVRDDAYALSISRDGSWLAFVADRREIGYREMWVMRTDGTDAHKVFEGDTNNGFAGAEWSPDGQRLSFEWGQRIGANVEWHMVSRNLKGGPAVKAIPSGVEDWVWSPDGRMIYSLDEPNSAGESCNFWDVRIDRRTGRPLKPAERLTNWAGFCLDTPSVTSDGKRLAFRRWSMQGSAYIAELDGNGTRITQPKRLTLNEGRNYPVSWTVDNKAVIFGSYRDGRWRIYKQPLNGDTAEAIDTGSNEDVTGARLSPDGTWIFYISLPRAEIPSPTQRLMGVPIAGGPPRLIMTASLRRDRKPDTGRSTYGEPRCSRRPATLCAIAERTPDRKQLVFTAFDVNGPMRELLRFNTDPKSYFDYVWDLSPDGTRIAILKSSDSVIRILSLRGGPSKDIAAKDGSSLESVSWTSDGKGLFASSHTKEGLALLHLDQQGNSHVVWEQNGGIPPWDWPFPQWVFGPSAPWAVPSSDGRHLAIYEWNMSANMWIMENF